MNRIRLFLLIIALTLPISIASAQDKALEFMGGGSLQPYKVRGDVRSVAGAVGGGNVFLRYTHYFPGHFGIFAQIGTENVYCTDAAFFGRMNKADGRQYLYRFINRTYFESSIDIYSIGVAYKWNAGSFRFTPRLAAGIGDFSGYEYSYERRSLKNDSGPEYNYYAPVGKSRSYEYLIDGGETNYSPTPMVVSADFQISVFPDRRLFMFIQPGITILPFKICISSTSCGSIPRYNPENWAEALAYYDAAGSWKSDPASEITSVGNYSINPFLHLSIGVGINFGYRR